MKTRKRAADDEREEGPELGAHTDTEVVQLPEALAPPGVNPARQNTKADEEQTLFSLDSGITSSCPS